MSYVPCDNCGKYTDDGVLINDNGKRIRLCVECSTAYEEQEENNMNTKYAIVFYKDKTLKEYESTWDFTCIPDTSCEILNVFDNLEDAKEELKKETSCVNAEYRNKQWYFTADVYAIVEYAYNEDWEDWEIRDGYDISELPSMEIAKYGISYIPKNNKELQITKITYHNLEATIEHNDLKYSIKFDNHAEKEAFTLWCQIEDIDDRYVIENDMYEKWSVEEI